MGAAGSLSVCKEGNVEPPCGVVVATRSPSLAKTDPVVVVVALVFADVVSFDDAALLLFT